MPFCYPENPKNQNFEIWKNLLEISWFYTCVPKIIWCIVPEIQSETDRIFCQFGPFLSHIHVYHKWRSYDVWFLKYKVQQTEIFVILGSFVPFQPPDNAENHKWEPYYAWFLRHGARQTEFFVILDCFLPFYLPMNPEN